MIKSPILVVVLLAIFLVTELLGYYVASTYFEKELPYGLEPPEMETPVSIIDYKIKTSYFVENLVFSCINFVLLCNLTSFFNTRVRTCICFFDWLVIYERKRLVFTQYCSSALLCRPCRYFCSNVLSNINHFFIDSFVSL